MVKHGVTPLQLGSTGEQPLMAEESSGCDLSQIMGVGLSSGHSKTACRPKLDLNPPAELLS